MSSIIRIKKNDNFVIMDKAFLENAALSWKAKGILAHMLSKPDDWTFYIDELAKHSKDGMRSFRSGFKELSDQGYVKRKPIRKGQRIERWETIVYEKPELCGSVQVQSEEVQNVDVQKQQIQNSTLLSNDLTKNNLTNNNVTKNDSHVRDIFNHYLSKNIIKHNKITSPMRTAINARLKDYSYEQLIQAIDNYSTIYHGGISYWFDTKYSLADLMRDKDVRKFIDDADPLNNFKIKENNFKRNNNYTPMSELYDPKVDAF